MSNSFTKGSIKINLKLKFNLLHRDKHLKNKQNLNKIFATVSDY